MSWFQTVLYFIANVYKYVQNSQNADLKAKIISFITIQQWSNEETNMFFQIECPELHELL